MKKLFIYIFLSLLSVFVMPSVKAFDITGCIVERQVPVVGETLYNDCVKNQTDEVVKQVGNLVDFINRSEAYQVNLNILPLATSKDLTEDQKTRYREILAKKQILIDLTNSLRNVKELPLVQSDRDNVQKILDVQNDVDNTLTLLYSELSLTPAQRQSMDQYAKTRSEILSYQLQLVPLLGLTTDLSKISEGASCGGIGGVCCPKFVVSVSTTQIPALGNGMADALKNITGFIDGLLGGMLAIINPVIQDTRAGRVCAVGIPDYNPQTSVCTCINKDKKILTEMCNRVGTKENTTESKECISCIQHGFWTSIGCVDFSFQKFLQEKVFGMGLAFGGIVAFGCIIMSAFRLQFSQGDPKRIQKVRETLTSCIMGLLMIIFAVFILRLIGVNILKIPGFL